MKTMRLFPLELRRLLQSRLTWLIMALTVLSPVLGLVFYKPATSTTMLSMYLANPAIAGGVAGAILFPMDDITGFLYLIGSVFAPMIAVQIADHFILHRDRFAVAADARNLVIWLVGFIAYRLLMGVDTPVGYTLPDMVLTVVLCLLAEKAKPTKQM